MSLPGVRNVLPHPERRGGGVRFFIHDNIDFKVLPQLCFETFESISVHLSIGNGQDINFHTLYGPSDVSKSSFVEGAALSCCKSIIFSHLNLHLDKQDSRSQKFNDSLCQYKFTQIIDSQTHIQGFILDVVCVRDTFSQAVCPKVTGGVGSDHLAIMFSVNIPIKAHCKYRKVNTRKMHKLNMSEFREDILNSDKTSSHNIQVTCILIPCAKFLINMLQ